MSQIHYLCGFNSVVSDALWDPGQCSAVRFGPQETLIYQRIGKLEGRAVTFTVGSMTTTSFHVSALDFDPSEMSSDSVFCAVHSSVFAVSW